jgi:broad specificity phosphatase PhoE
MHLILVRHGATTAAAGCCVGQQDVGLSAAGLHDIRALADSWNVDRFDAPARIVASDLRRARDSAAPFVERFGIPLHVDRRLREMSFGEWDGRDWSEIARVDAARLRTWGDRWTEAAPPGGETVEELRSRARAFLNELSPIVRAAGGSVLVVAHAGWIRAAISVLLVEPPSRLLDRPIDHARVSIVRLTAEGAELAVENAAAID